ncbi:MAG: DEAD/DEAH box helicase family protein, partial [Nanoarchaeota archaeon]|nr:DEAD/DEAH box helicase family protein [Nanoarchaeota archaeon]
MFEEGQYVEVRGQRWQILEVRPFEDSTLLNLYGVDEQNKGKTANLFDTIDEIKPIGSKDLKLPDRPGLYPNWKSIHDSILFSLVHNREILASINYGRLSIEKYQLIPVKKALKKPIVRFLIADDTGLGKTIEAGLLMMELISRGRGKKIMIVTPAALQDQWKDEMSEKFNMDFTIYDSEAIQEKISEIPVGDNPWQYNEKIITSIDYVKRDDIKKLLKNIEWDLVIVDEAHYLSKTNLSSDRWRFGEFIKDKTENLIFLTATPHNGYSQSFFSLIQMLNEAVIPDLSKPDRDKATEYYTRRLKNQIYVDGKRKFTDRLVQNVPDLKLNSHEQEIYEEICEFAKKRWRLAKKDNRQMAEAFAMVVLKKRLLSSFEALKISLNNLLETAEPEEYNVNSERSNFRAYKDGLATEKQSEAIEKKLIRSISNRDKNKIKKLLDKIDVVISHGDSKKKRLLKLLDGVFQSDPTFKVIIFTEYRDTKSALKKY